MHSSRPRVQEALKPRPRCEPLGLGWRRGGGGGALPPPGGVAGNYGARRWPLPSRASLCPSELPRGDKGLVAWGGFPGVSEETWPPPAVCSA